MSGHPSEIYALLDPRDGAVRYIGKANDSLKRFKGHLRDAARRNTPVYCWMRKLRDEGIRPGLLVLETCDDWQAAERRLIAEHRANGARLLNVADGGEQPFCSANVCAENGRANAKKRNPKLWYALRMLGQALRDGYVSEATKTKLRSRPDLFGQFAVYL